MVPPINFALLCDGIRRPALLVIDMNALFCLTSLPTALRPDRGHARFAAIGVPGYASVRAVEKLFYPLRTFVGFMAKARITATFAASAPTR
jgi:hypothetical protein